MPVLRIKKTSTHISPAKYACGMLFWSFLHLLSRIQKKIFKQRVLFWIFYSLMQKPKQESQTVLPYSWNAHLNAHNGSTLMKTSYKSKLNGWWILNPSILVMRTFCWRQGNWWEKLITEGNTFSVKEYHGHKQTHTSYNYYSSH